MIKPESGSASSTRTSSRGFTLIELLLAVALLSVVVAFTVPAMATMAERRETIAAVERIYSELQLARSTAVAMSQPVFMNISSGDNWALGVSNDANCDPIDNSPACSIPDVQNNNPVTRLYTVADNDNVRVNAGGNQITFFSQRGTATPTDIVVTSLGDIGYVVNIQVLPLGQIIICSQAGDPRQRLTSYRACAA